MDQGSVFQRLQRVTKYQPPSLVPVSNLHQPESTKLISHDPPYPRLCAETAREAELVIRSH